MPLLVSAVALFYTGCAFAFFLVLPSVFGFLARFTPDVRGDDARHRQAYLDFVLVIFLAFGASFELPVALVILVLLGWVTPQQLRESRGYAVVGIFVHRRGDHAARRGLAADAGDPDVHAVRGWASSRRACSAAPRSRTDAAPRERAGALLAALCGLVAGRGDRRRRARRRSCWSRVAAMRTRWSGACVELLDRFYGVFARQLEARRIAAAIWRAARCSPTSTLRQGIAALASGAAARAVRAGARPSPRSMLVLHVAFERSRWQGSPGKRALGLRVVDDTTARRPALAAHACCASVAGAAVVADAQPRACDGGDAAATSRPARPHQRHARGARHAAAAAGMGARRGCCCRRRIAVAAARCASPRARWRSLAQAAVERVLGCHYTLDR